MTLQKRLIGWAQVALILGLCLLAPLARGQNTPFTLPPPADAVEAERFDFYAYDPGLPLNAQLKPLDQDKESVRYHLTYESAHDQTVTAILAIPKRYAAPYPAVVLMHGSGGNKDTSYIKASSAMLCSQGYATISIDGQYRGERGRPDRKESLGFNSYVVRDALIQTVIDLRRAVDYLETRPDIDKSKIGYLGFSLGAIEGSIVGGLEPRICCFLLAVPGGGLVNMVKNLPKMLAKSPELRQYVNFTVTPEVLKQVEDIANIVDPIYFVGRIQPRPLLILIAKNDEIIPPESSAAIVAAAHAKEGEQVKRLAGGHATSLISAFGDMRRFFNTNLGVRAPTTAAAAN